MFSLIWPLAFEKEKPCLHKRNANFTKNFSLLDKKQPLKGGLIYELATNESPGSWSGSTHFPINDLNKENPKCQCCFYLTRFFDLERVSQPCKAPFLFLQGLFDLQGFFDVERGSRCRKGFSMSKGFHNLTRLPFDFVRILRFLQGFFDFARFSSILKAFFDFQGIFRFFKEFFDFKDI